MSPAVSGPVITVTRSSFDPRMLSDLVLWLPYFNIPAGTGGDSLSTSDIWPGAPELVTPAGTFAASPADGVWAVDPAGIAFFLDDSATVFDFPWITGQRAIATNNAWLDLVDTGTTNPRTITLTGPLTFLGVLRNGFLEARIAYDDDTGPLSGFMVNSDHLQVQTSTTTPLWRDVSDNFPEADGSFGAPLEGNVFLFMLTRDASDLWRCWINGVEQIFSNETWDGSIVIRHVMEFNGQGEWADFLLYSADHSGRAGDLNTYFAAQHGTP